MTNGDKPISLARLKARAAVSGLSIEHNHGGFLVCEYNGTDYKYVFPKKKKSASKRACMHYLYQFHSTKTKTHQDQTTRNPVTLPRPTPQPVSQQPAQVVDKTELLELGIVLSSMVVDAEEASRVTKSRGDKLMWLGMVSQLKELKQANLAKINQTYPRRS